MKPRQLSVLTLSSNDLSGSRFNGHDLHEGLLQRGVESTHGSFWETSSKKAWSSPVFDRRDVRLLAPIIRKFEAYSGMQNRFQYWTKSLLNESVFHEADVVHLNIVHDHWFRFETVSEITKIKPTVWTWHDLWPVTGHCIQPGTCGRWQVGCGSCPDLARPLPVKRDRTRQEFLRKLRILSDLNVDIHVTTDWMKNKIQRFTNAMPNARVHVVPFGLSADEFPKVDRNLARRDLGIPTGARVVLARATDDPIKQFSRLLGVLSEIEFVSSDFVLLGIGSPRVNQPTWKRVGNLSCLFMPWTNNAADMAKFFAAADLTYQVSIDESFGMLALESMVQGRPVMTATGSATAEISRTPDLEVSSSAFEADIVRIARQLVDAPEAMQQLGDRAAERASRAYGAEDYIDRMTQLYRETYRSFHKLD